MSPVSRKVEAVFLTCSCKVIERHELRNTSSLHSIEVERLQRSVSFCKCSGQTFDFQDEEEAFLALMMTTHMFMFFLLPQENLTSGFILLMAAPLSRLPDLLTELSQSHSLHRVSHHASKCQQ